MTRGIPQVVGIDPSLTSTGCAIIGPDHVATFTLKPPGDLRGHHRLAWLLEELADQVAWPDLVVMEAPVLYAGGQGGRTGSSVLDAAGLSHLIRHQVLWAAGYPYAMVTPPALKKFATGSGATRGPSVTTKADVMLAAARVFPVKGQDEADALVLAMMGRHHLGFPVSPSPHPVAAAQALAGVDWPPFTFDAPPF